ncbi:hypothetical protein NL108_015129 [Boleophthalmus pectinirostris]|uniref:uncharacterized protein LOC110175190 isoform X2 n=1 Tax=Boleophthalmus pectinirostris TaxID=150288 RepID=UPI0024300146|nr:uncharacterized protein LOC110175190 isoform X2 [Boleophthalmus pectinirostris]KAJ0039418.1 hypothetical protein NL108_015129 [Boleophthalmus pectinirostris]
MACSSSSQVSCQESNMEQPEQSEIQPQEETEDLLKELKDLEPDEDLHKNLQQVADDYQQNNIPATNLNELIKALSTTLRQKKSSQPQQKDNSWRLPGHWLSGQKKAKVYVEVAAKTFGADEEILKKISVEKCSDPADCDVVLLFCPVTTRVGSDVDDAMRNISGRANGKKVVLVVMHHSREDISLSQCQQHPEHQNIIKYVDVVYHQTKKGLIKCARNDKATNDLKEFCQNLAT